MLLFNIILQQIINLINLIRSLNFIPNSPFDKISDTDKDQNPKFYTYVFLKSYEFLKIFEQFYSCNFTVMCLYKTIEVPSVARGIEKKFWNFFIQKLDIFALIPSDAII